MFFEPDQSNVLRDVHVSYSIGASSSYYKIQTKLKKSPFFLLRQKTTLKNTSI